MKFHFKHVATAALAVAMSLSLNVSAFAAVGDPVENGNLTVTGDQLAGKEVTAIQMFTARATEGTSTPGQSYVFDSYVLEDEWVPFFATEDMQRELKNADGKLVLPTKPTASGNDNYPEELAAYNAAYSDAAVVYLQWLETQSDKALVPNFAEAAQDWAVSTQNAGSLTDLTETATATQVDDTTTGSATFRGLTAGYYLVFPEMGGTGNANVSVGINPEGSRGTDAMLINIPTNTTWNIKSTYPTVEKKVDTDGDGAESNPAADNGSAQVGDVVTFTLTSAVPDTSDYKTYVFQFTDKLPKGLTLVNADEDVLDQVTSFAKTDVTLTIAEKNVKTAKFEASAVILTEGNLSEFEEQGVTMKDVGKTLMTVKIADLTETDLLEGDPAAAATGDKIVLTYKAMINENAVTTDSVTNEASVQYSNDPNGAGLGTSTPDETDVYTYKIKVNKWADDAGGQIGNLAGAQFVLSTSATLTNGESDISVIKLINTDSSTGNAYRVAKPGEKSAVTSFTTTDSGDITISGLEGSTEPGTTYYLHEIKAPAGYNKLKAPVKIVITIDNEETGKATITVDGEKATGDDGTTVNVENKKGIELPETGSIGTIGLTVAGVAVVLAGVMLPRKKKNKEQE